MSGKNKMEEAFDYQPQDSAGHFLVNIIKYLTIAIAFVPLFTVRFFMYPYTFSKTMLFYLLVDLMLVAYLWLVAGDRNFLPRIWVNSGNEKIKRFYDWVTVFLFGYFVFFGLAVVFAIDKHISFWGNIDWSQGFLTLLHLVVFFVIITNVFKGPSSWLSLLRAAGVVMFIAAVYSSYQWLVGKPNFASFGNTGYLGGFLVMGFFQMLILYFWPSEKEHRWYWALGMILILIVIYGLLDVRSAAIGLLAGCLTMGVFYLLGHNQKKIRKISAAVLIFAALVAVSALGYLFLSGKVQGLFERSVTVNTRLFFWEIGWKAFKEHPFFGYGPENYYIAFETFFDPKYYTIQSTNGVAFEFGSELPHNKIVEVAANTGSAGLIAYVGLLGVIIIGAFYHYKKTRDMRFVALGGLFVGYLTHDLFLFDTIGSMPHWFLMLGLASVMLRPSEFAAGCDYGKQKEAPRQIVWVFFSVLTAGALWFFVISSVRINYFFYRSELALRNTDYAKMLEYLEKGMQSERNYIFKRPVVLISNQLGTQFLKKQEVSSQEKEIFRKVITFNEEVVRRNPYMMYGYATLANLYTLAGVKIDGIYNEKVVTLADTAFSYGSKRPEILFSLAEAYINKGDNARGEEYMNKAIELNPEYGHSYYVSALGYFKMGQEEKGIAQLEKAFTKNLRDSIIYKTYLEHTYKAKFYDKAIFASRELLRLNPNDAQEYANLAMIYFENKQYDNARDTLRILMEKFPSQKKIAEDFLKKIAEEEKKHQ
jgi:O-antigen ligase/tetratricopeptide (TPR) repeat protein